jgi:hypothetical protein
MTSGPPSTEHQGPAERRLSEHLQLLRADPPEGSAQIVATIIRRARWQRMIRQPLLAITALTASIGDGIRMLLGARGDR